MMKLCKRKNNMLKSIILLLTIICMVCSPMFNCYAANANLNEDSIENNSTISDNTIRVGWYNSSDGAEAHSYDYEYLQALSQYTGWTYEYVEGSWSQCLNWLENGEIDILGFVQKTPEREAVFGFPSLPMAVTSGYLVGLDSSSFNSGDPNSLEGKTIGVVDGNGFNESLFRYIEVNGIHVTYKEYPGIAEIPTALANGEIDAAVVAEEDKTAEEHILLQLSSQNQYFATDIDNQALLEQLDRAMLDLYSYYPELNSDLYKKYFQTNSDGKPIFTTEELAFIENNPNILVLYDSGWPPVEYWDDTSGTYKGISPDIFALLTEKCGINFVYEGSTSGDVLDSLQNGDQKNTLTTISYDFNWAEQHDVYITQPFISSGIVRLGRNLSNANPTVAINEKAYFTYLLQNELVGVNTVNYSKQAERLEAVRSGAADYTYVTEDQANYYRSIPKYSDLQIERMIGYEQSICISISKKCDPELMSIISKSLVSISHDEMSAIIRKNTINAYQWSMKDYLYAYRLQSFFSVLLLVVIIFSFTVLSSNRRNNRKKLATAYEKEKASLVIAENASRAKGDFMSRMSHEIRTPLNAIIGYNTIAKNEVHAAITDEERKQADMKVMDCLTKSEIASKHLLTIINDVLDMSAIESGKIKIVKERFDFKGLINSVTTVFYSQARTKGVKLDVVFSTMTAEWFIGDQLRVNQILTNLLSNAIKFTPEGGSVQLSIWQPEADQEESHVCFEVKDTGIGMSKEALEHIWAPFEQADSSIARRFGGTGLGMTITKNLVDLMDGEITVTSKCGVGTTFKVDLMFEQTEQTPHLTSYDFHKINALFVDDDRNTCDYVRLLFDRCGARCTTVMSGMDAIEAVKIAEEKKESYSICLVDWQMPQMDGIETVKRIREIVGNQMPVIVLTAYDYSELADQAKDVGINTFISKPLFQSSLFDLLVDISGEHKTVEKNNTNENDDYNNAKVILAEDNKMNMEIANKLLEYSNLSVEKAWNGEEAVKLFLASNPGTYQAIFMDVRMPVMDGIEATKAIRKSNHPDAKTIPIIAMTADAFAENVTVVLEAGMDDHIAKPIEMSILRDKLRQYIRKK